MEILQDSKYRPIFSEKTTIKIGDGDPVNKAGKILLRFINELVSDEKMYKKGAMNKFLLEYFALKIPEDKLGLSPYGGISDIEENAKTAGAMKITECRFEKYKKEVDNLSVKSNIVFRIKNKEDNKFYYFLNMGLSDVNRDPNHCYLLFSNCMFLDAKKFRIKTKVEFPTGKEDIFMAKIKSKNYTTVFRDKKFSIDSYININDNKDYKILSKILDLEGDIEFLVIEDKGEIELCDKMNTISQDFKIKNFNATKSTIKEKLKNK